MKKFFKNVLNAIRTGFAWLLAIPFVIIIFIAILLGVTIGILSNKVFEAIGCKINSYSSKSEDRLDSKIEEYKTLKIDLEELLERAEKETGQ